MKDPVVIPFDDLSWIPHPSISGIEIKLFNNSAAFSPSDLMVAKVETGSVIPWHVHEEEAEIAYMLIGEGTLYYAETEAHDPAYEKHITAGKGLIIPPGTWHSLVNTGAEGVHILALHTR